MSIPTTNDATNPLVSVVICTRNRLAGLQYALRSVQAQAQSLPDRAFTVEVIVVDDGSTPPAVPDDNGPFPVRVVRIDAGRPGAARNAGLDAAAGTIVTWCDDDDVWTPTHLATVVPPLLGVAPPALVAAFDGDPAEAPASTVALRVDAARDAGGFDPGLDAFEDWDVWHRIGRAYRLQSIAVESIKLTTPVRRDQQTYADAWVHVNTDETRFRQRQRRNVRTRAFVRSAPFDPTYWQRGERRVLFQATPDPTRSFGFVARTLIEGLDARGLDVVVGPFRDREPNGYERFWRPIWSQGQIGFVIDYRVGPSALGCERVVHYTTFDSTHVPPEVIREINEYVTLLLVPSRWNIEIYRARGVTVPIRLLPHGVDPVQFPSLQRPQRDHFTIGTFGDLSPRKGTDLLVRAFLAEFDADDPVRLLIKQTFNDNDDDLRWPLDRDPRRVEVRSGFLDQPDLLTFLRELDLFVLPSRGEGFGLCGLEAMATGLPTIATNWAGPADYLDPADSLPLNFRLVDANAALAGQTRYFGQWAEPDEAHLRSLMRWAYRHRAEAAAMGKRASARVHRDWTWASVINQLEAILDAVAVGTTPV